MAKIALLIFLISFASPDGTFGVTTLQDGLVGHYLFDGSNTTTDSSASGNNLNVHGATIQVGRRAAVNLSSDYAYSFDGASYLASQNNVGISANSSRTFSAWIYVSTQQNLNNQSGGQVIGFGTTGITATGGFHTTGTLFSLSYVGPNNTSMADPAINFQLNGSFTGANFSDRANFMTDQWQHVVLTYDGSLGSATLYLNGNPAAAPSFFGGTGSQGTLNTTDSPVYFGMGLGSSETWLNGFQGAMDDVRIYSRALGASEVNNLYALEVPEPSTSSLNLLALGIVIGTQVRSRRPVL